MGWLSRLLGPHLYDERDRRRQLADLSRAARVLAAHHAQVDPEREEAWLAVAKEATRLRNQGWTTEELKGLCRLIPPHGLPNPRAEVELTPWQEELRLLLDPAYDAVGSLRAIGER